MVTSASLSTSTARTARPRGRAHFSDPVRSVRLLSRPCKVSSKPRRTSSSLLSSSLITRWGMMDYDFGDGPDFPRVSRAALRRSEQRRSMTRARAINYSLISSFRYQPTTAFQTQLNYNKRRLARHDTGLVAYDDNIFSSRSTYQFSRNTFARLRLDYSYL